MRHYWQISIVSLGLLILVGCGGSSTPQPYTNMATVQQISAQVAARYGEAHPQITQVTATLSDGATSQPMNIVMLAGHFHKGTLQATRLSFSMLANGQKIWAIAAFNAPITGAVWVDQ